MTSLDVLNALKKRFCPPDWMFASELSLVPGYILGRRADAIALNCLTSGEWGLAFLGFEIKVSRGDLMAELREPKKRQETYTGTDALFIAAPKGLCDKRELPDDLGLIEVSEKGNTRIKKRPKMNLPMELCNSRKFNPALGYTVMNYDLDKIPGMRREICAAFIRSFEPGRINTNQYFENNRLKQQNQELKTSLKHAKDVAHSEFEKFCYKKGASLWRLISDSFCV